MPFDRIRMPKGSEIVMSQIKERILAGDFPPGSRLPSVAQLSESFQLGRSTIREALSALKAMGWIDIRHGGGTFVKQEIPPAEIREALDPFDVTESFQEIVEVRKYIEAGCAALAATRRSAEDLEALDRILSEMEAALGDEDASETADITFHVRIAEASGNPLFIQLMHSLTQRLQEHIGSSRRIWFFAEKASAVQLLKEHRAIAEAIRSGSEKTAFDLMMRHIEKVDRVVRALIREP